MCRLARRLKIPLREQTLKAAALFSADEVFLTNALMNVMRVKTIISNLGSRHRRTMGPSPITDFLQKQLAGENDGGIGPAD